MKRKPFYETQQHNPFRQPDWRWRRAMDLVHSGKYFSKKRDDPATGIAVSYLKELNNCGSESKQLRIKKRYSHVTEARCIYEIWYRQRLEIEARLLARQSDTEIGLELNIPPQTVQAYRDLFFHIDDHIEATTYIMCTVIGIHPAQQPRDEQLFKLQAYHHGPLVIPLWLDYFAEGWDGTSMETEHDRGLAAIWLYIQSVRIPIGEMPPRDLARQLTQLTKNGANSAPSISAGQAFSQTFTQALRKSLPPVASLPPLSYAPAPLLRGRPRKQPQTLQFRRAA